MTLEEFLKDNLQYHKEAAHLCPHCQQPTKPSKVEIHRPDQLMAGIIQVLSLRNYIDQQFVMGDLRYFEPCGDPQSDAPALAANITETLNKRIR